MKQNDLPLDCNPGSEAALRRAYELSALPGLGYTFERAMTDDAMKRCLKNVAGALIVPGQPPTPGIDFEIPASIRKLVSHPTPIDRVCPYCGAKHTGPFQACPSCKTAADRGE